MNVLPLSASLPKTKPILLLLFRIHCNRNRKPDPNTEETLRRRTESSRLRMTRVSPATAKAIHIL